MVGDGGVAAAEGESAGAAADGALDILEEAEQASDLGDRDGAAVLLAEDELALGDDAELGGAAEVVDGITLPADVERVGQIEAAGGVMDDGMITLVGGDGRAEAGAAELAHADLRGPGGHEVEHAGALGAAAGHAQDVLAVGGTDVDG